MEASADPKKNRPIQYPISNPNRSFNLSPSFN